MVRISILVVVTVVALVSPCAAQSRPEPIAHGCFSLTVEGEGPSVPETIRIDLFLDNEAPEGGMPNAWRRPEVGIHPLDLPPLDGVWVGMRRPYGIEVQISDLESDDTALIIFNRVDDRLEGVPASYMQDGELVRGDFTLWAAPTTCTES